MALDLEQPATLHVADPSREHLPDYETGWGAITAAAWMLYLGQGVPTRIVLANGDEVSAEQIHAEYERMKKRGEF